MKTGSLFAVAAAIAVALHPPAASAQDDRTTDNSGTVMDVTAWRDVPVHRLVINIVDLPGAEVSRVRQRERDKQAIHQEAVFDGKDGWLQIQYIVAPGMILSQYAAPGYRDGTGIKEWASRFWAQFRESFDHEDRRRIYAFGERAGWAYMTRGRMSDRACLFARVAFLSDGSKGAEATEEVYDTTVIVLDCSGKRSLQDAAEWLGSLKIVPPEYNRLRN